MCLAFCDRLKIFEMVESKSVMRPIIMLYGCKFWAIDKKIE